ncbi:hypothetical protein M0813_00464 [Anaeramoeba flamelloides]|nr:hypothetical protein M0813_00464 [Anaeramoeba flamelloides]
MTTKRNQKYKVIAWMRSVLGEKILLNQSQDELLNNFCRVINFFQDDCVPKIER